MGHIPTKTDPRPSTQLSLYAGPEGIHNGGAARCLLVLFAKL